MSDDLERAMTDTEPVSVGSLREVLAEALSPIHKRLDRIEDRLGSVESDVGNLKGNVAELRDGVDALMTGMEQAKNSLAAVRRTMTEDIRPAIDGLKQDVVRIDRRLAAQTEAAE